MGWRGFPKRLRFGKRDCAPEPLRGASRRLSAKKAKNLFFALASQIATP